MAKINRFGHIFRAYFCSYKQLYQVEFRFFQKYYETTKGVPKLSPAYCFVNGIWSLAADLFRTITQNVDGG